MWKQYILGGTVTDCDFVSEELSSVETGLSGGRRANYIRFQKNLVVWKHSFYLFIIESFFWFQKNLVVWKLKAIAG